MNDNISKILAEISPLRKELNEHALYTNLKSLDDVKIFMEVHVYAVWDFMSLLKSLQQKLTTVNVPWVPVKNAKVARLINQIVVDEESDLNADGVPKSHFEMYLEAMEEVKANTLIIQDFISDIKTSKEIEFTLKNSDLPKEIKSFLNFTFKTIQGGKAHEIAAAFTFGREEVIPDMFLEIIQNTEKNQNVHLKKINFYLQRHIELDGDEHGPLAHEMLVNLCEQDNVKWEEVCKASKAALKHRILLWDYVLDLIKEHKTINNSKEVLPQF